MTKRSCQNCIFEDRCSSNYPCNFYAPIDEDDSYEDQLIEQGREQFRSEWADYLEESWDS